VVLLRDVKGSGSWCWHFMCLEGEYVVISYIIIELSAYIPINLSRVLMMPVLYD
jgi:hypothetical protein